MDAGKVGLGPPPLETERGWLLLYHGVRVTVSGAIYRLARAPRLKQPERVIARSTSGSGPQASTARGDVTGVVFPCGWTLGDDGDTVYIYYGAPTRRSASQPRASPHCSTGSTVTRPDRRERAPSRCSRRSRGAYRRATRPWEQFVSLLTEGLVDRGIDVTLFATADRKRERDSSVPPRPATRRTRSSTRRSQEALHFGTAFERAGEFDLIHNSADCRFVQRPRRHAPSSRPSTGSRPSASSPSTSATTVASTTSRSATPTATRSCTTRRRSITASTWARSARDGSGNYLLFFGRIHPDKGAVEAIDPPPHRPAAPARRHRPGQRYFDELVAPRVDGVRVRYLGAVGPDRRGELLGRARALVHLVNFDEPFGFSVVEAMACGTPVVAHPRGSLPELVRPGENGFLVSSLDEAAAAVNAAPGLDRARIRASVERRFAVDRMVDDYVDLYRRLV